MGSFQSQQQVKSEIQQIEEWTGMKIGNIIFDSDIDNWKEGSSEFDLKVINKSSLIFLIEGEDNNLFGGYVNALIDKRQSWIKDPKSFLFSLKSNGRLKGMMKFEIKDSEDAFWLWSKHFFCLFVFGSRLGHDMFINKENKKSESWGDQQNSFNYNGLKKALCGKFTIMPIRITVIQLI